MSAPTAYAALFEGMVLHLRRTRVSIEGVVRREWPDVGEPAQIVALYAESPDLHFVRQVTCTVCRREWSAVFPVATTRIECPSCGSFNDAVGAAVSPSGRSTRQQT